MATARRQITCVDILPACRRQQRHLWAIVAQARQQVGYQTALLPGTHIGRCLCSTGRPICRDLEPQANLFPMGLALQAMPSGSTLAPSRAFTHWQVPARRCTASPSSGQTPLSADASDAALRARGTHLHLGGAARAFLALGVGCPVRLRRVALAHPAGPA